MRVNHCRRAMAGNVVDNLAVALEIRRIHRPRHLVGHHALHQERHAEDVHALVDEDLDGARVGEGVVGALAALDMEYGLCILHIVEVDLPPRQGCCCSQTLRQTRWIRTLGIYISV